MSDRASGARSDEVSEAAAELYRLTPEEFIPARDERVKALRKDGNAVAAKQVAALRKPTVGAWLVNLLVDAEPGLAEQVTALADQLRAAQEQLSGDDLRALGRQRQERVSGLVARSRALARDAGRTVTGGVLDTEVESSLRAALADPDVAREVLSGRLTHATEFTGFGSVTATPNTVDRERRGTKKATGHPSDQGKGRGGASGKGAGTGTATTKQTAAERRREEKREQARARLDDAEQTLEGAQAEHAEAEAESTGAAEKLGSEKERLAAARAQLDDAQKAHDLAAEAVEQSGWRKRRAAAALKAAQASVLRARDNLARTER